MKLITALFTASLMTTTALYAAEDARQCDFSTVQASLGDAKIGSQIITSAPDNGTTTCDFYAMGWNNFLYLAATDTETKSPRMLTYAPWYYFNLDYNNGKISDFPASKAELDPQEIGKFMGQAGDAWHLKTTDNLPVVYDVRMNKVMYDSIAAQEAYKPEVMALNTGTSTNPVTDGSTCSDSDSCPGNLKLAFPPSDLPSSVPSILATQKATEGAIEYKSAWVDFGTAKSCPSDELFCEGQFGLVGFHMVQKTIEHGEWIWWSFEYVGNAPDCTPSVTVGDNQASYASLNPISSRDDWIFFDKSKWQTDQANNVKADSCATPTPTQAFFGDDSPTITAVCSGSKTAPANRALCNQNPMKDLLISTSVDSNYMPVNVCRTDSLPAPADIQKDGLCAATGTQTLQNAQMSCLNQSVASGDLSVDSGIAPLWMKNYIQIGSIWTLAGVSATPAYERGNVQLSQQGQPISSVGGKVYMRKGFPHLANTTLETWMQKGAHTPYCDAANNNAANTWEETDCLTCHKPTYAKPDANSTLVPELPKDGRVDTTHLLERVLEANEAYQAN